MEDAEGSMVVTAGIAVAEVDWQGQGCYRDGDIEVH